MEKSKMKSIEFTDYRTLTSSGRQPCITIPMDVWKASNIPIGENVLVELKITPISLKELINRRKQ
jgi:hypothetical protein